MKEILLIVGLLLSSYVAGCFVEVKAVEHTRRDVEKVMRGMGN